MYLLCTLVCFLALVSVLDGSFTANASAVAVQQGARFQDAPAFGVFCSIPFEKIYSVNAPLAQPSPSAQAATRLGRAITARIVIVKTF